MIPLERHLHNSFQTQNLILSSSKLILMKTFCSRKYIYVFFFTAMPVKLCMTAGVLEMNWVRLF